MSLMLVHAFHNCTIPSPSSLEVKIREPIVRHYFELLFWLDDPPSTAIVRSDLRFMIWTEFAKHGIEIPFPQRDVHIRDAAVEGSDLSA